jgi:tetratricopeptide (TPR) repeat protein
MKRKVCAALLLSSCLAVAQAPATPAPPPGGESPRIKQAQQLNSEGKYEEALAVLDQVLAVSPQDYEANLMSGIVLDMQADFGKARGYLQKAIDLAPSARQVQALRTMAVSYAFECDLPQVANYEQQAFDSQMKNQKFTDAAGTANELARINLECGDVPNATKWYQTGYDTAMRQPNMSEADRYLWQFRWENAKARIAAREGKAKQADADVAAAKVALDKSKNADQQRFFPYLTGYVAFYAGNYKAAIEQLQAADQKDPFVLVLLAQANEKLGNQAEATKYYRQILTINTHSPTNAFARPLAQKKLATAG